MKLPFSRDFIIVNRCSSPEKHVKGWSRTQIFETPLCLSSKPSRGDSLRQIYDKKYDNLRWIHVLLKEFHSVDEYVGTFPDKSNHGNTFPGRK